MNLGILVSGNGSNLQAIIDSVKSKFIKDSKISIVICNKENAFSLERCKANGIEAKFISPANKSREEYCDELIRELLAKEVDLICLAGFMLILSSNFINSFRGRILNIHPSLLPDFGGVGMYGKKVHEAVVQSGARRTGATVHFVEEECDRGPIIIQESVGIDEFDTVESIAKKVLEVEHRIYPKAINIVVESLKKPSI